MIVHRGVQKLQSVPGLLVPIVEISLDCKGRRVSSAYMETLEAIPATFFIKHRELI